MNPQENKHAKIIHRAEFRMAMQEVFGWRLPLPDKILAALANSQDFDRLLEETQLNDEPRGLQHFQRFARDQRVEFLVKEILAAEGDYLTPLIRRIMPILWEKLDQFLRWALRLPTKSGENSKPQRPVPVFKTMVLALASYGAYFVYNHHLKIDLILPKEISTIHVDAAPLKVEPAKLSFAPLRFDPGEIKFGQVQFPELKVQPVSFADPQFKITSLPDVKFANGGRIQLDTISAHIDITQPKPFSFDPLQFKQDTQIPIRFDPQSLGRDSALQLAIHNVWDMPSTGFPVIHVKDKRDRLFWPSHDYTLTVEQGRSGGGNTNQAEDKKNSSNTPKQAPTPVRTEPSLSFVQEQP
ncbi:MAG TPA: hypothetical protein VKV30_09645 [Candidatus Angelobacter sp.]|nr:hypothetical protein [Candidatus Angelobacter sp.]